MRYSRWLFTPSIYNPQTDFSHISIFYRLMVICDNFWCLPFFGGDLCSTEVFFDNFLVERLKSIKKKRKKKVQRLFRIFDRFLPNSQFLLIFCHFYAFRWKILVFLSKCTSALHKKIPKQLADNPAIGRKCSPNVIFSHN